MLSDQCVKTGTSPRHVCGIHNNTIKRDYVSMGIKEDVIAAATDILQQTPQGMTKEALVRQIAPLLAQRPLPAQVIAMLRKEPQTFVEGGDGRWRLRQQADLLMLEDMTVPL